MLSGVGRTASPEGGSHAEHPNVRYAQPRHEGTTLVCPLDHPSTTTGDERVIVARLKETASWAPTLASRTTGTAQAAQRLKRAEDEPRRESSLRLPRPIGHPHLIHLSTGIHIMKNARSEAVLQARNEKMTLRPSAASIGSKTHAIDAGPTRRPREKPHLARRNDALTALARIPKVITSAPVSI